MARHVVNRTIERVDHGVVEAALDSWVCLAGTAAGRRHTMDSAIGPLDRSWRIAGPAITVTAEDPLDVLTTSAAAAIVEPGDVVVIDAGGRTEASALGATMVWGLGAAGAMGIVTDGAVLTANTIVAKEGVPVFAAGTAARTTSGTGPGSINVPIVCGGIIVNPGDLVMGDADGVVVLPRLEAASILDGIGRRQPYPPPSRERPYTDRGHLERLLGFDEVEELP